MTLQKKLPMVNYAVLTGVIERRKGINLTHSGLPVIHLLVENTMETYPGSGETASHRIQVDVWGKLATGYDKSLLPGIAILAEGELSHKQTEDSAGALHFQTVLKARRLEILTIDKERKA